jgi:hypothetical protein
MLVLVLSEIGSELEPETLETEQAQLRESTWFFSYSEYVRIVGSQLWMGLGKLALIIGSEISYRTWVIS